MAQTKLYCSMGTYRGFSLNLPGEHQRRTRQPAPLSPNSSGFWWRGREGCGVSGYGFWGFGVWGFGEPQGIAMNRSLVVAMGLALAAGAMLSPAALAQSPFPPAPQQSSPFPPPPQQSQLPADSTSPFPAPPRQSQFPAPPQQSVFPSGPQGGPPMQGGPS